MLVIPSTKISITYDENNLEREDRVYELIDKKIRTKRNIF